LVEGVEEGDGGVDELFAAAWFDAGAFCFVGFFGVAAAVGDIADGAVGEGGDDGDWEGRAFFEGEAEFCEDFAGEGDPCDVVAEGDDLDLCGDGLAVELGEVEDAVGVDEIVEGRRGGAFAGDGEGGKFGLFRGD
jgi:hypothetical protein